MLSQLTHIKSDPLDVLLFAVGLRLTQLAKTGDDKFKSLLDNRNFTIQLGSEAEGTATIKLAKANFLSTRVQPLSLH